MQRSGGSGEVFFPNKSAAIREALAASTESTPKEIAEKLQAEGYKVTGAYVSIVKSADKKKAGTPGRTVRVKRRGAISGSVSGSGNASGSFTGLGIAALQFIQACGGLDQAKAVLATVEQLRAVV